MTRYSIEPRDRIYVQGMDFCLLLKIWVNILAKSEAKI